jgi:hypothetical protein
VDLQLAPAQQGYLESQASGMEQERVGTEYSIWIQDEICGNVGILKIAAAGQYNNNFVS